MQETVDVLTGERPATPAPTKRWTREQWSAFVAGFGGAPAKVPPPANGGVTRG